MFEKLVENIKGYRKPLAFGIARVDLGQLNHDKVLQATYPIINWNENFGSAAVFIRSLIECGVDINFEDS
jgi:2,3,4,5-tetrahydropyridine-2-carboxylate N-succinyltransferase